MDSVFIVIDGPDGVGKGFCLDHLKNQAIKAKKKVFDVDEYWEKSDDIPSLDIIGDADVLITSEPTYQGIGKYIRETLVSNSSNNKQKFSTDVIAQAFSLDRQILYERLIIPARAKGISVFQSRSVSTSIAYQKITGKKDGVTLKYIMSLPGNRLALENAPDYLVIPTLSNLEETMKRLKSRNKRDNCVFEKLEFQLKVKKEYDSRSFRRIFESRGTKVVSIDVGGTKRQTRERLGRGLRLCWE